MAEQISFLIIGNGIAGITAAETLRTELPDASIGIIADDDQPVYFRPALKDFLAERVHEEKLWARPPGFYQQQQIHFLVDHVARILPDQHMVVLRSGGRVHYGRLLLATGAQALSLTCPGADLAGVTTLRTLDDYQQIQERLTAVRRVVVSGSGTLALETVETLRGRGFHVTHLLRKRLLWSEVLDATASDLVMQEEQRAGVDIRLECEIASIEGAHGSVTAVMTGSGERIPCEIVLIAIGIVPNVDYIQASGIACRRGVLVDEYLRTNAPDIYAAGDVVESVIAETGRTRLVGQWYPAIQQARAAAYSMLDLLDTARPFRIDTFYNATFLYGLPFASVGVTNIRGYRELVADPQPRIYRKLLLCDDVPVGLLSLGHRKHTLAFKRAIDHQVNLSEVRAKLFDDDFDLAGWLDERGVLPLQLGVQRIQVTDPLAIHADPIVRSGREPAEVAPEPIVEPVGEEQMLENLTATDHTEAFLLHVIDAHLPLRVAETLLTREKPFVIGRQPGDVDLVVNEGSVSRRHASVRYQDSHFELCDLGSLNGTFINGQRLVPQRPYELHVNDEIRYGNIVTFRFLLRALNLHELATNDPTETNRTAPEVQRAVSATNKRAIAMDSNDTYKIPAASRSVAPQSSARRVTPGAAQQLPPAIVNALKQQPALIVLPAESMGGQKQPPAVHLLQDDKLVSIGRVDSNDIVLPDRVVSRNHAEVYATAEGFYIRDLGSSNGSLVNQSRIEQPYRLAHGDHITLGTTIIIFVDLQSGREQTAMVQSVQPGKLVQTAMPRATAAALKKTIQAEKLPVPVVICPQCGLANMPRARFCASCSTQLRAS